MKTFTQRIVESSAQYLSYDYRKQLIKMLINAFKEEMNAFYAYFITKEFLSGINRRSVEEFFDNAAKDELYDHATYLLKRINQLGGYPTDALSPSTLNTSNHTYITPTFTKTIQDNDSESYVNVDIAIRQNIEAERGAIDTYREIADFTQNVDIITHKEIKRILEDEIEHLQELLDLKSDLESLRNNSCPTCDCGGCNYTDDESNYVTLSGIEQSVDSTIDDLFN